MKHTDSAALLATIAPVTLQCGGLIVRVARTSEDFRAIRDLRRISFRQLDGRDDSDAFDPIFAHLMVRDSTTDDLVASARLHVLTGDMLGPGRSYAAQFYDLDPVLARFPRTIEVGRICLSRSAPPDTARALLSALARHCWSLDAQALLGCASFRGADPERHGPALDWLRRYHLAPVYLRGRRVAAHAVDLPHLADPAGRDALACMPTLLRLYLGLGGWVSDHIVIDTDLDTLHVLTVVPVDAIPPARRRSLLAPMKVGTFLPIASQPN
jgi:putative hemolysin